MREGWKRVKIGYLGEVITGNTPPKKDPTNYGGDYPFIKPTDMEIDRRYVNNWEENYSEKAFKRYKNSYIPPKATGVVTIGTVGEKIFQADRYCFTNQSVNVVIPNKNYDEDFVYYVLKINLPKVLNANPGTASGRHHVSKSNFCAIKIDVPKSIETQRKIAAILSAYDDLIENNLKRIKLLEEQAQLTYEEWFVRFKFPGHETTKFDEDTGLPEGWEKVKLTEVAKMKFGYAFKASQFNSDGLGKPIIRIRNIPSSSTKDFTTEIVDKKYIVKQGDLLIGMDGEFYVNNWSGPEGYLVQRVCCITSNKEEHKGLITEAIRQPIRVFQASIDGATVAHLGKKHLDQISIIIPKDLNIEFFTYLLNEKINLSNQNQHLKEARDILLPRLMSGMIDVEKLDVGSLKHEVNDSLGKVAEGR